jgi:hypothetical protein
MPADVFLPPFRSGTSRPAILMQISTHLKTNRTNRNSDGLVKVFFLSHLISQIILNAESVSLQMDSARPAFKLKSFRACRPATKKWCQMTVVAGLYQTCETSLCHDYRKLLAMSLRSHKTSKICV